MPWDKNLNAKLARRISAAFVGTALLVGASGAAIAQNMVVRASGPSAASFPAGKKFGNSDRITLKKLDKVTILGKSGTRVLKGPGTFSLSAKRARTTNTARLASFINNRSSSRVRTGAVRSAGAAAATATPTNPNLWYLDVTKGGRFCVADPATLVLWRPDYTGSATASIVEPGSGNVSEVEWRTGNPLKSWPSATAPLTSGAKYQLIGSNVEQSVEVDFVMLDNMPGSLDEAASALIANGCDSQLDLLVDTMDDGSSEG